MVIYLDVLFFKNFIINYFLIDLTEKITKDKIKTINKIVASIISSIISVVAIVNNWEYISVFISKIILAWNIISIVYYGRDRKERIRYVIIFYCVTCILGGVMCSISNYIKNRNVLLFYSLMLGSGVIFIGNEIAKHAINKGKYMCDIKIVLGKETIDACALLDSGHNLQDAITGETVVIINEEKIHEMSEILFDVLKGRMVDVPSKYETKIRMVTYKSLGNENGILHGVCADSVIVYYDGKQYENKNVIVAASQDKFENFDAIVGLNLIEGGIVCGNSTTIKIKG